jgi:RanBP1 domain
MNGNSNVTQNNARSEDAMMESPQKKQNGFSFNMNNTSTPANAPFTFGQTQPNGLFSFGTSQSNSASASTASVFGGMSTPEPSAQSTGLFGSMKPAEEPAPTSQSANLFSFGPSQTSQASNTNVFGSIQSQTAPSTQSNSFSFGQTSVSQPPSNSIFGQGQPQSQSFTFGQNQPSSQPNNIFGGFNSSKTEEPKQLPAFKFGQANITAQPVPSIFGQPSSTPTSTSNLFGRSNNPSEGPVLSENKEPSQNTNPFGGLFGQSLGPAQDQSGSSSSVTEAKPVFTFGSTSQIPNNLFGSKEQQSREVTTEHRLDKTPMTGKSFATSLTANSEFPNSIMTGSTTTSQLHLSEEDLTPRPSTTPVSGFNFNTTQTQANSSNSGVFGNVKPTEGAGSKTPNLFGQISRPEQGSQNHSSKQQPDEPVSSSKSLFGPNSDSTKSNQSPAEVKTPVWGGSQLFNNQSQTTSGQQTPSEVPSQTPSSGSNWFNKTSTDPFKSQTSKPTIEAPHKHDSTSSTSNSTLGDAQKPSTLFGNGSKATPATVKLPNTQTGSISDFGSMRSGTVNAASSQTQANDTATEIVKIRSRTNGPGYVPNFFDNDKRVEHDKTYRLMSLDYGFSRQIASLDFKKRDFAITVRSYIAARESIGQPIGGLYTRVLAGSKRKVDDSAGSHEDVSAQSKRAKADHSNLGASLVGNNQSSTSLGSQASSSTSSLFQDMISTPATTAKNTADVAPPSTPPKNIFATAKPTSSFAASAGFKPSGSQESYEKAPSSKDFAAFGKASQAAPTPSSALSTGFKPLIPSTTPSKSPPKKPFEIPKFGVNGNTNFMASFAKQAEATVAKEKAKRKAEDFDSDEETEAEYEERATKKEKDNQERLSKIAQTGFRPSFGNVETAKPANAASSPSKALAQDTTSEKSSGVAPSASSASSNNFTGFGQDAKTSGFTFGSATALSAAKPTNGSVETSGDEDSQSQDNGENDDEETDGNYDPENEQTSDGSNDSEEAGESEGHFADDDAEESSEDFQAALEASQQNKGKSLFERITPNPERSIGVTPTNGATPEPQPPSKGSSTNILDAKSVSDGSPILQSAPNKSFKAFPIGSDIFQSTPKVPAVSPFTPINGLEIPKQPAPLAKTFNFTSTPPTTTPTPVPGASVLFGGSMRGGSIPGEGLFGSRPSTPNNGESTTAGIFSNLAKSSGTFTPRSDNTWKAGNAITFGTPEKTSDGPVVSITTATPSSKGENNTSKTLSTLFGGNASSGSTPASSSGGNLGFSFGAPAPGFLGVASHLLPSANSSAVSSRATSPGATDNESVCTNDTEDLVNDPQTSLMTSRPGEEGEEVLYEGRSKAMKYFDDKMASGKLGMKANEYNTMGVGEVRILKNKETKKTRILFRAEPSSNIVINSNLVPSVTYISTPGNKSGTVRFAIVTKEGIEKWVLRTKTNEMANELAAILEKNKA